LIKIAITTGQIVQRKEKERRKNHPKATEHTIVNRDKKRMKMGVPLGTEPKKQHMLEHGP
jgi:hypothetical protein